MELMSLIIIPILLAFVCFRIGRINKVVRDYFAIGATLLMLLLTTIVAGRCIVGKEALSFVLNSKIGFGINLRMDGFRALYCIVAVVMWFVATTFSKEYLKEDRNRNRYYFFILITLGATLGVFMSESLATTYLFFELASLCSFPWVIQEETKEAIKAANTYLAIAIIGGLVTLMGLFLLYDVTGTLVISQLRGMSQMYPSSKEAVAAGICIFVGFAAKAGAFPLHIWLPKAHPVAPASASALLSGILTKVGIFGVLVVSSYLFEGEAFWGKALIGIAVITMLVGAVLALFSIDLKRTLACSSVSQIGFILSGVACLCLLPTGENAIAAQGTVLYMINHSLFKLVLFIFAGIVFMNTKSLNLNDVKGYGRKKPLLMAIYALPYLGISGVPFFSGYVSKTLVHESIVMASSVPGMKLVEWLFLISGGMTFAYMTKLFVIIFLEKNTSEEKQREYDEKKYFASKFVTILLLIVSSCFFVFGILPKKLFGKLALLSLPFFKEEFVHEDIAFFSFESMKGSLISLLIGLVLYFVVERCLLRKKDGTYVNPWPKYLDMEDYFYKPILDVLIFILSVICRVLDRFVDSLIVLFRKTLYKDSPIPVELSEGNSVTHVCGSFVDGLRKVITGKDIEEDNSVEHRLALFHEKAAETNIIVTRSLSFGLIFFCLGLVFTLLCILWWK